MNKNVCIIHFNTPVLTAHLVKSINKHTPGTKIYIFDNSDKTPFINSFNNVTVFDNTKGQIINFDQWLKKYPNREKSGGKANNWGSAKHAYSVEKCMELIKEPFVLFDSDVLVKKDFSILFDEIVCYKGEVIHQPGTNRNIKRVLPFICFINTPMCKTKGIHYFDENYMHGLRFKGNSDNYDTGGALYILTEQKKGLHREIKVADYIVHYGNGSWVDAAEKMKRPKHMPAVEWLNKYKEYWSDNTGVGGIEDLNFSDVFDHIYCLHYLPATDRYQKMKDELKHVGIDDESDYFSWVYDYPSPTLDIVYNDKRLNMNTALKSSSRDYIKRVSMKHYQIVKEAYSLGYGRILILENDVRFHRDRAYIKEMLSNMPDTDIVMFDKMVCSAPGEGIKYQRYVKTLPDGSLYGSMNDSGVFFIFCSCYALNRNAMKHIIDAHESSLLPPDTPLNDKSLTGSFAVINLAIQDPKLKTRKSETYDKIGLNTDVYDPISDEEKVVKNDSKPKQVAKPQPQPAQQAKPKPIIKPKAQKQDISPKVVFRVPTKPQLKKKIEVDTSKKPTQEEQVIKHTKPIVTRMVNPKKTTRSRIIVGKPSGFNKLYDV